MEKLLPDHLKELWRSVELGRMTREEFTLEQERLVGGYRGRWQAALLCGGQTELESSLVAELALYFGHGETERARLECSDALANVKGEWHEAVDPTDRRSVERFYNDSRAMIYELMWWHTLCEDNSPLAYVTALHFAELYGCRRSLDFGAGVGSGGVLFARSGLEVTLADISSPMLDFSRWRFELRGLEAEFVDLKVDALPSEAYDLVVAMDVFEHLVDPVRTVDDLWRAMKPGGYLFGRFHAEMDEDRPHHIVQDFAPTLERLRALGFVEVWRDEWLWGHQAFRKA